ncbi:hypothetical protein N7507_002346 [Penicillium longicatenatum]|nr:hypothetical protein N7507_002346 [Penicillium longicatenatum]
MADIGESGLNGGQLRQSLMGDVAARARGKTLGCWGKWTQPGECNSKVQSRHTSVARYETIGVLGIEKVCEAA